MQQTEMYKLNLIERTDPFLPDALNENMEKVEGVLSAKADTAETGQQFAALDSRVTALEAHHVCMGSYKGSGKNQDIDLGFSPVILFITPTPAGNSEFIILYSNNNLKSETGLHIASTFRHNTSGYTYHFVALA